MKTLQEIRDLVAKKHGFKNWEDVQAEWLKRTGMAAVVHEEYVDEVAKLFAQEACKEQREICAKVYNRSTLNFPESEIKNAPEPNMI